MALGVLLSYVSHDETFLQSEAELWLKWISNNRACSIRKPKWLGGGCLVRSPMYRYSPDDNRSNITPIMWALRGRVWEFKGWPKTSIMENYKGSDGDISIGSAQIVPLGYQLHLLAVQSYIKWIIGQSRAIRIQVSEICYERQPNNLFYKIPLSRRHTK